jgi:hypothetical protein
MSEATAPMISSTTPVVEQTTNLTPTFNPDDYELRWGLNPIQRDKILDPRTTGIIGRVPFCKWFPIRSFPTPREIHSIDWTQPKEGDVLVTAAEAQVEIEVSLGGKGVQQQVNWGFVSSFVGVRDAAMMEVVSQTLFPRLSTIREICDSLGLVCPIARICEATDELDYGSRESCPTCWSKWLGSDALTSYIDAVANTGMVVLERDSEGQLKERTVRPAVETLQQARMLAKEALRVGINSLKAQWETIASEYGNDKSGRKDITEFEHQYRKDLHQIRPQDRQVALVSQMATAINGGAAHAGGNSDAIDKLAATVNQLAQIVLADKMPQQPPTPQSAPQVVEPEGQTVDAAEENPANLSPGAQALKTKGGNKPK